MGRCQYCNNTSEKIYNVKRHEQEQHLSNPSLKNNHFGYGFDMDNVQDMFDIRLKENFKHFSCEFCAYTSMRRYDVKTHTRRMHMIKTDEYGQDVNNEAHSKQKYETYDMNEDKYLEIIT